MNKYWKQLILGAVVATAAVPAAAAYPAPGNVVLAAEADAPPSIRADRTSVNRGNEVSVTGTVRADTDWVTIRAVDSAGNLAAFDAAKPGADGQYRFTFTVPAASATGDMQIYIGDGELSSATSVRINGSGGGGGRGGSSQGSNSAIVSGGVATYKPRTIAGSDGRTQAMVEVDARTAVQALQQGGKLTIAVQSDADEIVAALTNEALQALLGADRFTEVEIVAPAGTYTLPASLIDLAAFAKALGASEEEVSLQFTIGKADASSSADVEEAADRAGASIVAGIVDFAVAATTADGESAPLEFGNTYVARSIPVPAAIDADRATGVFYDEEEGTLTFVPSVFRSQDGQTSAAMKRTGNSLYTVIEHTKSFRDVGADHWGKDEIELLASKLIVNGMTEDRFGPSETVTRAQFAAMAVRALGLAEAGSAPFGDVAAGEWYAGAVGAAYEAGLVTGYEDGTFRPNQQITRQELAVLIDNALRFVGAEEQGGGGQLDRFADRSAIAAWAQSAVANIAAAGIAEGRDGGRYAPSAESTRAEAAAMILRLLRHADFID